VGKTMFFRAYQIVCGNDSDFVLRRLDGLFASGIKAIVCGNDSDCVFRAYQIVCGNDSDCVFRAYQIVLDCVQIVFFELIRLC